MSKIKRQIVKIDEDKCDGCGLCVPSCEEGAIQIIDGKARLVSEIYCDGLGACLGECPKDAISIEKREAEKFDEEAVEKHLKETKKDTETAHMRGCPGMMARTINRQSKESDVQSRIQSELSQWPIQLRLIPPHAPYLKNADLVLLADCTAVAYANLHADFIKNKIIAMACPKLDDAEFYVEKLKDMINQNGFNSIEVVMMEVPCCSRLETILDDALQDTKFNKEVKKRIITIGGEINNTPRRY